MLKKFFRRPVRWKAQISVNKQELSIRFVLRIKYPIIMLFSSPIVVKKVLMSIGIYDLLKTTLIIKNLEDLQSIIDWLRPILHWIYQYGH